MSSANSVIVLDFETTGLSPNMGDRAIEIDVTGAYAPWLHPDPDAAAGIAANRKITCAIALLNDFKRGKI